MYIYIYIYVYIYIHIYTYTHLSFETPGVGPGWYKASVASQVAARLSHGVRAN